MAGTVFRLARIFVLIGLFYTVIGDVVEAADYRIIGKVSKEEHRIGPSPQKGNFTIEIYYPEFQDKDQSQVNFEKTNNLIEQKVWEELQGYAKMTRAGGGYLELNYEIGYRDDSFVSIKYFGHRYLLGTPHTSRIFFTQNIDLKEGVEVGLRDLCSIDDDTLRKFLQRASSSSKENAVRNWTELGEVSYSELRWTKANSYWQEDRVAFFALISHGIGDYMQYEVSYDELRQQGISFRAK